jgi:RimJ/RimL family protein N-acetyltransferase
LAIKLPETRPTLDTDRLILRPFALSDAARVQALAGDVDVASTTLHVPHPYEDGMAELWIENHPEKLTRGEIIFAVTLRTDFALIGAVGLATNMDHENAELGYWIGKPYWNHGYGTEAARAVLDFAFATLRLRRVFAHHFSRNVASGRVLKKIGMTHEGRQRQHVKKWGRFEDIEIYGIVRGDSRRDAVGNPG